MQASGLVQATSGQLFAELIRFGRWRVATALALMAFAAALEGTGLLLLGPLLGLASGGAGSTGAVTGWWHRLGLPPSLPGMLMAYVLLIGVYSVVCWRRDTLLYSLQSGFLDHLRQQLFDAVGSAEWAFLAETRSAEFSHSLTADLARTNQAVQAMLQGATTFAVLCAYIVAAVRLDWRLTAATLVAGGLALLPLRGRQRGIQTLGQKLSNATRQIHADVSEFLAGLKLAKSSNAEPELSRQFRARMGEARQVSLDFTERQAATSARSRMGAAVCLAGFAYLGLAVFSVAPASLLVLAFIFARLLPFASQLLQQHERILHSLPAFSAFVQMRHRCREHAEPPAEGTGYTLTEGLRLERVSYRHSPQVKDVLQDLSLDIPARSTLAIVGPSGAGKSTLADLLAGLIAPAGGRILADGRSIEDRRGWRRLVAYVPQDSFLFNASVRDNLAWAAGQHDDAGLWGALELAAAADFVRALPQGLDTVVGERGLRLSGGERQRLAIARALLRNPMLLVLDEATSALDRSNELRIQRAIAGLHGRLTIVVIAHRIETIRSADLIVVLDQGGVIASGSYEMLAADQAGYLMQAEVG